MDSKAESEEHEEEEASEESESGVASLALVTAFVSKSIFNSEEIDHTNKADEDNGLVTDSDADDEDDSTPTYCFMARGAKDMPPKASEDSESGVASLALATAFVSKSIFNSKQNRSTNKADEGNDD